MERTSVFDELLEQALAGAEFAAVSGELRERLREDAVRERELIASQAVAEYAEYVRARGPADGSAFSRARDGILPAIVVLAPLLSATAAVVFLVIGFVLRLLGVQPTLGDGLIAAGVVCAVIAVGAGVVGIVCVVAEAARHRTAPGMADVQVRGGAGGSGGDVERAREVWRAALMDRGVLPFLRARL
ncbi:MULTISPECIES: hypothetical protein [unclassified Streptomyces]|uniref:hypothetical protein n=1 Tax=unclassified Streptomyces TaxID=2593676 RepID=UPI002E18F195|nr:MULTISPECIES: hypothetical protein [unclassified Streptomyces]